MLKCIATTTLCMLIHPLWAQEVSNVQVQQNGEELMVTFDLSGTNDEYKVKIELAEDAINFYTFGEMECRSGKNEFRKELKETVFCASGIFRVSAQKNYILTDIDGNKYKTIKIGNQEWMRENLKVNKYSNGSPIPTNLTNSTWQVATTGAYAIYNNDATNNTTYGKLYNWYAVVDSRNLCPIGWHVPSDGEWKTLDINLGINATGSVLVGDLFSPKVDGELKSTSTLWKNPNTGATNESGFSGLPSGMRLGDGKYNYVGYYGIWWSSTETSFSHESARSRILGYRNQYLAWPFSSKPSGLSVRCLKD
jgi:uncharacterized protein (TIGR02145 family)